MITTIISVLQRTTSSFDYACYCYASLFIVVTVAIVKKVLFPHKYTDPNKKAVFITGCDSGFGRELALLLDIRGFHVFAGCLFPEKEGAITLTENASERLRVVPLDITDDGQVVKAAEFVRDHLGDNELWAIVNNAGVGPLGVLEWSSMSFFKNVMDINCFGGLRVIKAFLPLLRLSKGRIVNLTSLAGRIPVRFFSAYSMSKAAAISLNECLRGEMRQFNIKVISIEPGMYRTPLNNKKAITGHIEKLWENTTDETKAVYGEEYFRYFSKMVVNIVNTYSRPNLNEVTDTMVEAVCSERPSTHYVPFWATSLSGCVIRHLPISLFDKLYDVMFGMPDPTYHNNKPGSAVARKTHTTTAKESNGLH